MKNTIIFICNLLLLTTCTCPTNNNLANSNVYLIDKVILDDEIIKLISNFIQSNNDMDCIYEIYVDKKTEDEYFITLFSIPNYSDYFTTHFPINYTLVNNKIVFIYSGIEDFIKKEKYFPKLSITEKDTKDKGSYESLSIVIKPDTSYIVGHVGIPFIMVSFEPIKNSTK